MTTFLISLLILSLCFFILSQTFWMRHLNQAQRRGLYPDRRRATLFDVKRLITAGERILAIYLYREIYKGVGFKESQKAVEEMEKSINGKKENYT